MESSQPQVGLSKLRFHHLYIYLSARNEFCSHELPLFDSAGVYKGLHHTSSAVSSILPSAGPTSTSSPSPAAATTTTNNGTSSANHHVGTAGPAPGQALMGGAVRVSVPSPAGTLSVRQLQRQLTVPASALKLAANANRPIPKVTAGSTTLDMGPR